MEAIKLSAKQAAELLKAAGVAVEIVEEDQAIDTDAALKTIDETRTQYIRPQIEKEVKADVEQTTRGLTSNMFKAALAKAFKSSGVERRKMDSFEDIDQMFEYVRQTHDATFSKDTEELRNQLKSVGEEHAAKLEKQREEYEAKVKEAQDRYVERDIDAVLNEVVNAIPRTGGNASTQAKQLKAYLRENYNLHYNEEKKALELRDKNNPEMPVFANESKTAWLEPKEVAKTFLNDLGVVATDNRSASAKEAMQRAQAQGTPPPVQYQPPAQHDNSRESAIAAMVQANQ